MKNINIVFNDGFPGWNGETPNTPRPGWAIEEYLEQLVHTAAVLALPPVTEADNGKVMAVVAGKWNPSLIPIDDEKIKESVEGWLDDHPEATTTVQDGDISFPKLAADLKSLLVHDTVSGPVASFDYAAVGLPFDSAAVTIVPIQSGSGTPSQTNVRPISGITGLSLYVGPTQDQADATEYAEDWSTQAGTVYGGTVDLVTGVLTVKFGMLDLGTKTYTFARRNTDDTGNIFVFQDSAIKSTGGGNVICSQLMTYKGSAGINMPVNSCFVAGGHTLLVCTTDADAASVKASMSGVQLCYELSTPVTYQLTPQEIEALVGTNNVWASNGGNVSVTFIADTKSYIDKKIAEAHA